MVNDKFLQSNSLEMIKKSVFSLVETTPDVHQTYGEYIHYQICENDEPSQGSFRHNNTFSVEEKLKMELTLLESPLFDIA